MKNWLFGAFALLSANFLGAQALSVSMDKINPTCFSYTNGIAIANPTGGVQPYAFKWANGQAGSQNWGLPVGTYSCTVTDANGASVVGTVTLTQPTKMVVDIAAVNVECADYQGTLNASAVGGTPPYNYAWSTGTPAATTFIAGEGDYHVTVLDSKACHDVGTRYVVDPSQIFPNMIVNQPQTAHSNDGSITAQSIGNHMPHSYKWSTGEETQTITNLGPGTFKVSITDKNLCTKVETVLLKAIVSLDVTVNVTNSVCFGQNNGAVGAFVTGGLGPFSFSWTNGSGQVVSDQAIVQNLPPGVYTVAVTDGDGNVATASGTVTEPTKLEVSVSLPTANCAGGTYTVPVSISGGTTPYMITNNTLPVSSLPLTGLLPNTYYYLCVMDANKCQLDVPFTTPDNVNLTANMITTSAACNGNATGTATVVAAGGSGDYSFAWPAPAANLNTPSQNGLAPGQYKVTVTDNVNGCTAVATGVIGAHTNIAVFVNAGDALCVGSATGMATASASNGTAPYSFNWGTGSTDVSISGLVPGFYPVTVTDATGCSTVSGANIGTQIMLDAAFLAQTKACVGDNVEVEFIDQSTMAGQIDSWTWTFTSGTNGQSTFSGNSQNPAPPTQTFSKNQNITVQLTVSNANGCSDTQSSVVEITGQPIVVAPATVSGCDEAKITLTPDQSFYTYSWTGPNGFMSNDQNPTVTSSGQYTAVVTAAAGCSTTVNVAADIAPAVNLVALENQINVCDDFSNLTATATGSAGMTYSWYVNGVFDQNGPNYTANPLPNGMTVIVCEAKDGGCVERDTIEVMAHPVSISLSGNSQPCVGQSAMVDIVGLDSTLTHTYMWSPSGTAGPQAPIPTPTPGPQTISVEVTNEFGCKDTATFNAMVVNGVDLSTAIKIKPCNGLEVTFENAPAVPGSWNFGDGSAPFTVSTETSIPHTYATAGSYIATFTPTAECIAPFSDTVNAAVSVIEAIFSNQQNGDCDTDLTMCFKSTSNGATTYAWDFGPYGTQTGSNPNCITITQNGSFNAVLTVTNADGCTDTDEQQINVQNLITPPTFGPVPNTICEGDAPVALNPNGNPTYNYQWDNGLGTAVNPTVSPTTTTTYNVTVTNGTAPNTCSITASTTVNVNVAPTLAAPADQTVCSTTQVNLSATSNGALTWSLNPNFAPSQDGNTFSVTPAATGTTIVYVKSTTGQGCTKTDEISLLNGQPNIDFDAAPQTICIGASANLAILPTDPADNLTAVWSPTLPGGLMQNVAPTQNTTYTAVVTNAPSGCTTTAAFTVGVIDLKAELLFDKDTLCPKEFVQLGVNVTGGPTGATYTYNWMGPNLNETDIENPTAAPTSEGLHKYMVIVTVEPLGCVAQSQEFDLRFINPTCGEPFIFVPNAFTPNDNDGADTQNDVFFVRSSAELTELELLIFDRWGEQVFRSTDKNIGWDGTFKGEELTPDAYGYILRCKCADGGEYRKQGNVTILR